ncbi:MAG TPA: outer membrane beta-barrel protein, partial [Longimicrobium sp.]|nr:outer membrane beta-barrel protein [Longimicrobium sp.]
MKKTSIGLLAAVATLAGAGTLSAQSMGPTTPLAIEVRGGLALPTGDDADGLNTGFTVGGDLIFQATPMIGIYAGYNYNEFGVEDVDDVSVNVKGFDAGVRLGFPTTSLGGFTPFLKGGVLYQSAEITDTDIETDDEFGFEVGGGLEYMLGNRVSFTPAASYN